MITPATLNLTVYRGSAFTVGFECKDADGNEVDLTDFEARAQVRRWLTGPMVIDLTPTIEGNMILIDKVQDDTWDYTRGTYHWDIFLKDADGRIYGPYFTGRFEINTANTQPTT